MSLKDTATRVAALDALAALVAAELKAAKADLQEGLREAKTETGTQTIAVDLNGVDIGKATLVQPKPAATVVDEAALLAWVREVAPSEVTARMVVEVRPAWLAQLKKQVEAAGCVEWVDPETGVIHEVPGMQLVGRVAHTRVTVPAEGKQALAEAWRNRELLGLALPVLEAGDGS